MINHKNYPIVLKNINALLPFKPTSFGEFIKFHSNGLSNIDIQMVVLETQMVVYPDITVDKLLEATILVAAQNMQNDPDYEMLATRIAVTKNYLATLKLATAESFEEIYKNSFFEYIKYGVDNAMLNPQLTEIFDLKKLADALDYTRDDKFSFIGMSTLETRYMLTRRDKSLLETPQFTWMRVAMGMSLKEKNPTEWALKFYSALSKGEYIPGGSTIIGAGTTHPTLSNCYLIDVQDDIHSIFDNVKNVALISKATGGIGLSLTKLRAEGSPIKTDNITSSGPIPFAKVIDSTIMALARRGKKKGAIALYMENWHYNFPDFLDLRQNAGDDYRRTRTADTAVYISDEFMNRVIDDQDWYLFDPAETPELTELYGAEFSKKYNEYVQRAEAGKMKLVKKMPAKEQFKKMLTSLQSTSHPWFTWKDTINLRALNNNTGTIHCSNLCTEVCLPQDKNNIAVCNLLYVNLAQHLDMTADGKFSINWKKLENSVKLGMRHLDNLIDVNQLTVPEAQRSDKDNRAVGLGIMGFSEVLEKYEYAYDSKEAAELMDKITEFVSYYTIDTSAELAQARGSYKYFDGSMWSKGWVPYDSIKKVATERNGITNHIKLSSNLEMVNKLGKIVQSNLDRFNEEEQIEFIKTINSLKKDLQSKQNSNDSESQNNFTQNTQTSLDWELLRQKVKNGIRNATTMMIAPNASTGLVASTTPGIDPRFAQMFSRSTNSGKFLDINKNLVNALKDAGIWDKVKDQILENYGDIANIPEISDKLKSIYKTSFQIAPKAFIEIASRAQKWIDQSISRNMYLDTRDIDEMMDIYTEAWKKGLKTTYYLHMKPRHQAEQSTIKVNKAKNLNKTGFASVAKKDISESSVTAPVNLVQPVMGGGVGFAKLASLRAVKHHPDNLEKQIPPPKIETSKPFMCPIDPMERANCESCQ